MPTSFVLATGNPHKVANFTALLAPHGIAVRLAPEGYACEETAPTFAGNALQKARAVQAALRAAGEPPAWALADDSGLEVEALGGAPGVHSARYAPKVAPGGDQDEANRRKLVEALAGVPHGQRAARFVCALVALPPEPDAPPIEALATLAGTIAESPCGTQGFGYDALFIAEGHRQTVAEVGPAVKDAISHRAQALLALLGALRRQAP